MDKSMLIAVGIGGALIYIAASGRLKGVAGTAAGTVAVAAQRLNRYHRHMDTYDKTIREHDPHGYARHFAAGAIAGVGGAAVMVSPLVNATPTIAVVAGISCATIVGVLKEVDDSTGRGVVDWKDAAWTAAGGLAAFLVLLIR